MVQFCIVSPCASKDTEQRSRWDPQTRAAKHLVVNLYRWSVIPSPSVGGKSLPMLVVNLYRWSVIPSPSVGGKSLPMLVVNLYRWSVIPSPTVGGKSLPMVSDSTLEDNEIDQISSS
ncbi:hypothetical protein RRG08_031946 [Elysia crispata]|uniref:Uncharacterized protein n=1 Tax=Elysia crispata TaxID=231223 RepID=A0AAE1D9M3_9GAST|nr:hypothetical protein RRG08_031946 [Elysia crispata]